MRPAGVKQRFLDLEADDERYRDAHPELAFRVELTRFITRCGRQGFADLPVSRNVESLRTTAGLLDDPAQQRTGTDFEKRSIDCVQQLRRAVDEFMSTRPDATPLDIEDGLFEPFVRVPAALLLGENGPDSSFDVICWNAANALVEGIRRPYWSAQPIVHAGFHRPTDRFGLLPRLTPLTERYEDHPDCRADIAEKVVTVLRDFLDVAPWPR